MDGEDLFLAIAQESPRESSTASQSHSERNRHRGSPQHLAQSTPSSLRHPSSLSPDISYHGQRRPSFESTRKPPARTHAYRPSNLHYSSSRDYQPPRRSDTPPDSVSHGTRSQSTGEDYESQDSLADSSTVWDEVDELKSRLRRLELTRKLPSTSGAAVSNSSYERPRTATTTATTLSESPKHLRKPSSSHQRSVVSDYSSTHTLLQEALVGAKDRLNPSVYQVLQATANDALELAEMAGNSRPQDTTHTAATTTNGAVVPDREIRRKADSMCRSLTELCLALCDTDSDLARPDHRAASIRRASVDATSIRRESTDITSGAASETVFTRRPRGASVEPDDSISMRDVRRDGSRRSSLLGPKSASPRQANFSHEDIVNTSFVQRTIDSKPMPIPAHLSADMESPQIPLSRPKLAHRFSCAGESFLYQSDGDISDRDPTLKAPSRARTEIRQPRPPRKKKEHHLPSDYTVQQLRPALPDRTSSLGRTRSPSRSGAEKEQSPTPSVRLREDRRRRIDHSTPERAATESPDIDEWRQKVVAGGYQISPATERSLGLRKVGSIGGRRPISRDFAGESALRNLVEP